MFEQDYLMRMIMQLIEGIQRSMEKGDGDEKDPAAAADMLEGTVGAAVDMDGGVLLSLSPESIAGILRATGTDEGVSEYVGRSLYLESSYLADAGNRELADVRLAQARAIAESYGFSLDEQDGSRAAMQGFLESQKAALN